MKAKEGIAKTSNREKQKDVKKERKPDNKTPISIYVGDAKGGSIILKYLFPIRGHLSNINFIVNEAFPTKFSIKVETKKDDDIKSTITGVFECSVGKNTIDKVNISAGDVITLTLLGSANISIKDTWFSAIYKHQ